MGLLDYYRQFEDMDEEEVNRGLRERRAREKALALAEVPAVDLSSTEWPDFPSSEVVNAAIFVARGRVNGYPDRHAAEVRRELSQLHDVEPERIAFGNGAAELIQTAALALLSPGDELVTPWPSYPLYPLMARRAGARAVAVDLAGGRVDPGAVAEACGAHTRVVTICNPNDPTGSYLTHDELGGLLSRLPDHVHLLLDEALVDFQDAEPPGSSIALLEAFPRLLVFRSFSKIYGLSGLRAGYAIGPPGGGDLLGLVAPALGVNALTQAAARQALDIGAEEVARRRELVIAQRARLERALERLPVDAPKSEANFVWLRASGLTGPELTARLEREGVIVAPGGPLGDDEHVRASVRGAAATGRLIEALQRATA